MRSNRRQFMQTTAASAAAAGISTAMVAGSASGQEESNRRTVAAIGVGGSRGRYNRGTAIANNAARFGKMIAVCDVDKLHGQEFNERYDGKLGVYTDYRELLEQEQPQVVTIGTPDHWHVPIAIAALRSGADVYCEKPLTLTIDEGKEIRKVVEETGRVFQVGTQQRSENNLRFLKAIAMVHTGRLGDNVNAFCAIGGAPADGPFESSEVPDGLDWNMWVGPAPKADYSEERRRFFRWYFEYSGGKMTDWGAHHIDIAQWALAPGETGPVRVSGSGKFPEIVPADFDWNAFLDGEISLPNGYNTLTEFSIDLEYENGRSLSVNNHYRREGDNVDFGNGILFEGDRGRIFVNRGKLEGQPVEQLTDADNEELNAKIIELCKGKQPGNHMANFFACIEEGGKPISDVWSHQRTMTSCHLCNIAVMLGRDLQWDPKAEQFVADEEANKLTSRKSRRGFTS